MHFKRVLATAGIGLTAVVWTLMRAAQGEWSYYALAAVLTLATNLTIVELFERRPQAGPVQTAPARALDLGERQG